MRIQNLQKPLLYGVLLTTVINLIIFFIGQALDIIKNEGAQKSGNSLTIITVILYNSIIPVIASAIVLVLLDKLLSKSLLIFKIMGGIGLLIPVIMIVAQPNSSAGFKIISILMLLIPAGSVGYFLLGLFDKNGTAKAF